MAAPTLRSLEGGEGGGILEIPRTATLPARRPGLAAMSIWSTQ